MAPKTEPKIPFRYRYFLTHATGDQMASLALLLHGAEDTGDHLTRATGVLKSSDTGGIQVAFDDRPETKPEANRS